MIDLARSPSGGLGFRPWVPERFVTEYPDRCRRLLDMLEGPARKADLIGSFALLVASAAFNITYARMSERGPLGGRRIGSITL